MQSKHRHPRRALSLIGALCIAASGLTGCATRTPPANDATAGASASKDAGTAAASGVQTSKNRRFLGIFSPYRPDIQQGNFVSREMVAQLKESMQSQGGLTPDQVRFVMGTPLLRDAFHKDRWDYPFRLQKRNGEIIMSQVTLYFENNRLVRVDGGDLPTEKDYISLIAGDAADK